MNKTIFVFLFIFSLSISPLLSQEKKLIVIVERANIYLDPNQSSPVIETVEKGTLLNLRSPRKVNRIWYYVFVVSKETGMTKAGFILDSLVEMHFKVAKPTIIKREERRPTAKIGEVLFISPKKIKAISEKGSIRAGPSIKSKITHTVPLGTTFQSVGKAGEWYKVDLLPDKEGIVVSGYIHQIFVEEMIEKVPRVPKIKVKKPRIAAISPPKTYVPKKIETIPKSCIGAIVGYAMLSEENYGSGFKYGGSLCLEITKNIAIELSGLRFQSNVEGNPEALSEGKLSIIPIQLSLKARFLMAGRFVPYVLGGGGYYLSSFALDERIISNWDAFGFDIEEKVENAIGFHFGAGIDLFLTKNIALNADLRYCIAKTKGSWTLTDQFAGIETSGNLEALNLNSFMFGAGLKFYF